ncbi:hypothetical protein ACFL1H_04015 [Nanoarchaeota archaeon]
MGKKKLDFGSIFSAACILTAFGGISYIGYMVAPAIKGEIKTQFTNPESDKVRKLVNEYRNLGGDTNDLDFIIDGNDISFSAGTNYLNVYERIKIDDNSLNSVEYSYWGLSDFFDRTYGNDSMKISKIEKNENGKWEITNTSWFEEFPEKPMYKISKEHKKKAQKRVKIILSKATPLLEEKIEEMEENIQYKTIENERNKSINLSQLIPKDYIQKVLSEDKVDSIFALDPIKKFHNKIKKIPKIFDNGAEDVYYTTFNKTINVPIDSEEFKDINYVSHFKYQGNDIYGYIEDFYNDVIILETFSNDNIDYYVKYKLNHCCNFTLGLELYTKNQTGETQQLYSGYYDDDIQDVTSDILPLAFIKQMMYRGEKISILALPELEKSIESIDKKEIKIAQKQYLDKNKEILNSVF